jgi:hypothetical protein
MVNGAQVYLAEKTRTPVRPAWIEYLSLNRQLIALTSRGGAPTVSPMARTSWSTQATRTSKTTYRD